MTAFIGLAIAAGVLSIGPLLIFNIGHVGVLPLVMLTPLPLFAAGLSMGATAAVIASGTATLLATLFDPLLGAVYLFQMALPAALMCRQALLWQQTPGGDVIWYPLGRLAMVLAGLIAVYVPIAFALAAMFGEGLLSMSGAFLEIVFSAGQELTPAQRAELHAGAAMVPMAAATGIMLLMVFNGALAQGLLQRFGRNIRPQADITELQLPLIVLPFMVGSLLLAALPDTLGAIGKTLAAIGAVTYFLAGLGVIHAWMRPWSARGVLLPLAYAAIMIFNPLALPVIGLGLWAQISRLRRGGADRSEE